MIYTEIYTCITPHKYKVLIRNGKIISADLLQITRVIFPLLIDDGSFFQEETDFLKEKNQTSKDFQLRCSCGGNTTRLIFDQKELSPPIFSSSFLLTTFCIIRDLASPFKCCRWSDRSPEALVTFSCSPVHSSPRALVMSAL